MPSGTAFNLGNAALITYEWSPLSERTLPPQCGRGGVQAMQKWSTVKVCKN